MRALLFMLLAGCAPNSGPLSPHTLTGEPSKEVRIHRVGNLQVICQRLVGGFDLFLGCAIRGQTCDVFIYDHSPDFVLAHELKHCEGYSH